MTDTTVDNVPAQETSVPGEHQTGPLHTRLRLNAAARRAHPSHTHSLPRSSDRSQLGSLATRFASSSIKSPSNTNPLGGTWQRRAALRRAVRAQFGCLSSLKQPKMIIPPTARSHSTGSAPRRCTPAQTQARTALRFKPGLAAAVRPRGAAGTPCTRRRPGSEGSRHWGAARPGTASACCARCLKRGATAAAARSYGCWTRQQPLLGTRGRNRKACACWQGRGWLSAPSPWAQQPPAAPAAGLPGGGFCAGVRQPQRGAQRSGSRAAPAGSVPTRRSTSHAGDSSEGLARAPSHPGEAPDGAWEGRGHFVVSEICIRVIS